MHIFKVCVSSAIVLASLNVFSATSSDSLSERTKQEVLTARENIGNLQDSLEIMNRSYSKTLNDIEDKEKKLTECEKTKKCDLKTTYTILGADVTLDRTQNTKSTLAQLKKDAETKKKSIDGYVKDIKKFEKKAKLDVNDRLDMGDVKMEFSDLKMNYQTFISSVGDGEKRFAELSAKVDSTLLGYYVKAAVDKATSEKSLCDKVNQCSTKTAKKVFESEIKPFAQWKSEITGDVKNLNQNMKSVMDANSTTNFGAQ